MPLQIASSNSKPESGKAIVNEKNTAASNNSKEALASNADYVTKDTGNKAPATKAIDKYHTVKSGESLGKIADKYNVPLTRLKEWNKIKGSTIHPGDKLVVGKTEVTEQLAENKVEPAAKPKQSNSNLDFIYYTVRQGDTLWKIAQKHDGTTVEQIKKLNNISNEKSLKPGQKIKVAVVS
jgi:membrane-bound lytic murein transglycosylase D